MTSRCVCDTDAAGADATVSLLGSNLVGTLAAKRNTAAAGVDLTFNYKNAQDLIIGTAGGTSGIVTGNGAVDVTVAGGKLDVNQAVNAGGTAGGAVTLTTTEAAEATDATIAFGATTGNVSGNAVKLN